MKKILLISKTNEIAKSLTQSIQLELANHRYLFNTLVYQRFGKELHHINQFLILNKASIRLIIFIGDNHDLLHYIQNFKQHDIPILHIYSQQEFTYSFTETLEKVSIESMVTSIINESYQEVIREPFYLQISDFSSLCLDNLQIYSYPLFKTIRALVQQRKHTILWNSFNSLFNRSGVEVTIGKDRYFIKDFKAGKLDFHQSVVTIKLFHDLDWITISRNFLLRSSTPHLQTVRTFPFFESGIKLKSQQPLSIQYDGIWSVSSEIKVSKTNKMIKWIKIN